MTDDSRIERERNFHDAFFAEVEIRAAQEKYYFALDPMNARYVALIRRHAKGGDVLDYGCGLGAYARSLAKDARSVVGIDLSDVAVAAANDVARREGMDNVSFQAMDAEKMTFPDASFDLVFGAGILHHLNLKNAAEEIHRVLKPGGVALFQEPLGHNPFINAYRKHTPEARTDDEHPLLRRDFNLIRNFFPEVETEFFALSSLVSVPFGRGAMGRTVRAVFSGLDSLLFVTPLRWWAWHVLMSLKKPK